MNLLLLLISCFDFVVGQSDLYPNGSILHYANWTQECDPWRGGGELNLSIDYDNDPYDSWSCPMEQRSMSGCGDFDDDTRNITCSSFLKLHECSEVRQQNVDDPLLAQKHVCIKHPIVYPNYDTASGKITAPANGRHREWWPKYGEYTFIPPQRWLHAAEHGGAVFLYHPCLYPPDLCQLKRYIGSLGDDEPFGDDIRMPNRGRDTGKFRWILSPFKNLRTSVAIVTWGHVYYSNCFNPPAMDRFLDETYRRAWEDVPKDGPYDYLWVNSSRQHYLSLPCLNSSVDTPFARISKLREMNNSSTLEPNMLILILFSYVLLVKLQMSRLDT